MRLLKGLNRFNWTYILTKMLWLGVLVYGVVVGAAKITSLFLSWLNDQLDGLDLYLVIIILFAVGILMFLNPFIPGVPVYFVAGIIVTESGKKDFGFYPAMALSCLVGFVIKYLAIVLQQEGIGGMLGKKVYIRRMIGINSKQVQSIRLILEAPGVSFGKVAILIGGPDWPTSVLTGILGLNLWKMLFASLPIIFLIAPTSVAGALQLKVRDGGIWEGIASLALAVTGLVQGAAGLLAMYYIGKVSDTVDGDFVQDPEVKELDEKEAENVRRLNEITVWHSDTFPASKKYLLTTSCFFMSVSCHLVQLMPSYCFVPFEVTDSISCPSSASSTSQNTVNCLDGNALNFVKPLGWLSIATFSVSCVMLHMYYVWARKEVKLWAKKEGGKLESQIKSLEKKLVVEQSERSQSEIQMEKKMQMLEDNMEKALQAHPLAQFNISKESNSSIKN